eukprot:2223182-Ditylum_brightwellii.AAC.1
MLALREAKKARANGWEVHTLAYGQKSNILQGEYNRTHQSSKESKKQQEIFAQTHGDTNISDADQIKINIGGRIITTNHGNLTQQRGTMLEALFSDHLENELQHDGV